MQISKTTLKETVAVILSSTNNGVLVSLFESDCIQEYSQSDFMDTSAASKFLADLNNKDIEHKYLDSFGGEGMGDDYWSIFSFTKGKDEVLVKFNGYYQSYNGAEFSEWHFVEAKQKMVTVYSKVH